MKDYHIWKKKYDAALKIQAFARGLKARIKVSKILKRKYKKYIDPQTKQPFYVSPYTDYQYDDKPRLLFDEDVDESIMLPTNETEYMVICTQCECQLADVTCSVCLDSYCNNCFYDLHSKGNKTSHKSLPVIVYIYIIVFVFIFRDVVYVSIKLQLEEMLEIIINHYVILVFMVLIISFFYPLIIIYL